MDTLNIVFPEQNKVELREETLDPSLGPTQLLCAARCSLISTGTEMQCLRGVFDPETNWADWVKYPFRPGYSMVAEVLEAGVGTERIRKGDLVFTEHSHAQYFKAEARHAVPIPGPIGAEQGAWVNLAKTTQLGVRRAELQLGETVGVIGLGILGQLVTQYAYVSGARELFAIDPAESRLKLVRERPGVHRLAMDAGAAHERIRDMTGGAMLDVVFDVTGHPAALAQATKLVKPLGRVILLGDTATPSQQQMGRNVVSNSVSILGIHARMDYKGWRHPDMAALFLSYIAQGRMDVASLITHRFSPRDAAEAYGLLATNRGSAMGVLFDWTKLNAQ
ncbi:zinc-dependent alcohol dehydrogenase [Paenibacillus sp. GYB003]|uniref:zinc-dependent alcohol dehydrogenase n=1 Tax=Paenibacillus sp. GYB003 TaxID=2994392 RepID=UPI002F964B13